MEQITIQNKNLKANIIPYGATLQGLKLGDGTELVAGYGTIEEYSAGDCYFGATVGRTCNRTGKFNIIDGRVYTLELNERNINHLHGGFGGLSRKNWEIVSHDDVSATLQCLSPDGEDGYPGNLTVTAQYILKEDMLVVRHTAVTDKPTWVSLTNHSYFNLNGVGSGDVFGTKIQINAGETSAYNANARVIGRKSVSEAFGFDTSREFALNCDFDHNFYIRNGAETLKYLDRELSFSAKAMGNIASMKVYTDLPCLQFYTGGFIKDGTSLSDGRTIGKSGAFCLETQFEPGSPSRGENVLRPGEVYDHITIYEIHKNS